jgi:hypothetical protein
MKNGGHVLRVLACAAIALLSQAAIARGRDSTEELRALIEQQGRQIQELQRKLDAVQAQTANNQAPPQGTVGDREPRGGEKLPTSAESSSSAPGETSSGKMDAAAVKKIVSDYLKDNPGAGMPPSVQTFYKWGDGFVIRSAPSPDYIKWEDDCRIPFELRFRSRLQVDYYRYKVTDSVNHLTNKPATQNANAVRQADFSQLEVKRLRLIWEGTAFDPNLRFNFTLDGGTRGLAGNQNNKVVQTAPSNGFAPNTSPTSPIGGFVVTDHAIRLFEAWVAYDFHGCCSEKGCGPDCPDGLYKYAPTYTIIAGKMKPFFCIEEVLGSGNEQLVEFSMADWFFDADDDNLLMGAGTRIKADDDRLYFQAIITNGNESQFPNSQMDTYPGFNAGFWYDLGGNWNEERKRYDLFGDCLADIDYSCCPVVRLGGALDLAPMDRRSLYGDDEQSRVFVTPGGPQGGTRLINLLNGDTLTPNGSHAVDKFESYSYEAFACLKYRGFSLWNEWYLRDLVGFATTPNGGNNIIYQDAAGNNALFPRHALLDYGTTVQGGYFIIPKKLELVARYSMIRGESGDIMGNFKFTTTTIPTASGPAVVRVYDGAFRQFHEAREAAVGINYYFHRQLLKWQTDFGIYDGGNPAGGGQSPAGFIAGSDGWLLRTQIQLAF